MGRRAVALRIVLGLCGVALAATGFGADDENNVAIPGGVIVDAQGVLQKRVFPDQGGQLLRERVSAAKASLGRELTAYSKLRKVSINRLERLIMEHNGVVTEPMKHLAGLQRVKYVFYYPDTKDIVLAGPAEGWVSDSSGRVIGMTTGRPVVQLQDLVVALRSFRPGSAKGPAITCSIDPTKEGLAAMQQFLRQAGGYATYQSTQPIVDGLRTSLGYQTISISGVSPKTNMARVLVEADYRMKLIGIGLERPPVKLVSFMQQVNPAQVSRNALFRWYFVPDYQCVRTTDDGMAMELVGDGVKLIGEDELVSSGGDRQSAGQQSKASAAFAQSFTQKYAQLAERSPVYAELRNVIDLCVVAAFLQQGDYYGKAGWSLPFFGSEQSFPVEVHNAPRQVESAVAAYWKGNRLTTPIGGGVRIEASHALSKENRLRDEKGAVAKARQEIKLDLAKDQWWWD